MKWPNISRFYTTEIWKNCNGLKIKKNIPLRCAIIVYNEYVEYVDLMGDIVLFNVSKISLVNILILTNENKYTSHT